MHLLPRHKKLRKAKMDSAAWAWFPFLTTRGHSPWARTAVNCGYWLPSGKSVTPLLHWKHRFKVLSPNSPRLSFICSGSSWGLQQEQVHLPSRQSCMKQGPVRWRTPGRCTGWLCHTGTVPWVSRILRGGRSHATVTNSNWWPGEKVAAEGKGEKKRNLN